MSQTGIRKVAEEAGVSIGTVSKILNPGVSSNIRVSGKTRDKVIAAANRLNYRPSYSARLLRGESTKVIGYAVTLPGDHMDSYLSNYTFRLLNGIGKAAAAHSYQVQLLNGVDYRHYMDIKQLDALALISFTGIDNPLVDDMSAMFAHFNLKNYPYVVLNRHMEEAKDGSPVAGIRIDNDAGIREIAAFLIRRKVESIGFLGELTRNPQYDHRLRCHLLKKYLAGSCVRFDDSMVFNGVDNGIAEIPRTGRYSHIDGWTAVRYLHSKGMLPRCLVCGNDDIAQGVIRGAWELGIRIPEDLGVIGYDDSYVDFSAPGLTTVRQPLEEVGERAVNYLIEKLNDPMLGSIDLVLKPSLVERESV